MDIKNINNDNELKLALKQLEPIFQASQGTAEAKERDALVVLIETYESKYYPI